MASIKPTGPRHEDRGERRWQSPRVSQGFNGATARRPWRTSRRASGSNPQRRCFIASTVEPPEVWIAECFNGATARRPWRTTGEHRLHERGPASMGPRHEGRGEPRLAVGPVAAICFNGATARRPWRTRWLGIEQAAGFNGATARRPWRTWIGCRFGDQLQWGHSTKAVENEARRPYASRADASMGPRHEGRGEHCLAILPRRLRGFNGATARRPWRTWPARNRCQLP